MVDAQLTAPEVCLSELFTADTEVSARFQFRALGREEGSMRPLVTTRNYEAYYLAVVAALCLPCLAFLLVEVVAVTAIALGLEARTATGSLRQTWEILYRIAQTGRWPTLAALIIGVWTSLHGRMHNRFKATMWAILVPALGTALGVTYCLNRNWLSKRWDSPLRNI